MENSDRFYEPFLPPPLPPNRSNTTLSKIYDTVRPQLLRPDALPAATADLKKGATLPRNTAFSPDSQPIKAVTSPTFKKDNKPAELPVPPALSPSPPALPKRDIPYVNGSNSRPHTNVDTLSSQKLDSIYRMVSCIDQRLKNHFNPPQPPPRDDEPLSPKLKSSGINNVGSRIVKLVVGIFFWFKRAIVVTNLHSGYIYSFNCHLIAITDKLKIVLSTMHPTYFRAY